MDESAFLREAGNMLEELLERAEEILDDDCEIDLGEGELRIEFPDGKIILVNRNATAGELWLSSPSGGGGRHFRRMGDGVWRDTRTEDELASVFAGELTFLLGQAGK